MNTLNKAPLRIVRHQRMPDVSMSLLGGLASRFFLYVVFAGVATLVDMAVLVGVVEGLQGHYLLGGAVGYLCGMVTNFSINRRFTFDAAHGAILPQFARFTVVAGSGLLLNLLLLWVFVEHLGLLYFVAKMVSVGLVLAWSYIGHEFFTFVRVRRTKSPPSSEGLECATIQN